eukprot:4496937-Pyramimonas_sp.AAC.1
MTAGLPAPFWAHAVSLFRSRLQAQHRGADESPWKKIFGLPSRAVRVGGEVLAAARCPRQTTRDWCENSH